VSLQLAPANLPPERPSDSPSARKMRRHRAKNPNCRGSCCASHRKNVTGTGIRAVSQLNPALREEFRPGPRVTAKVTGNPSPPCSPSLPEKTERQNNTPRPSAAKRKRGPRGSVREFASFWGKECKTAGVPSLLGKSWGDLKTLLFAAAGGDLVRAKALAGQYIRDCGHTNQTPVPRELLEFTRQPRVRNGTAQIHIDNGALQKEAPGRKML